MLSSHLAPGSYQRPGMDYFVHIFKDPPNVDELLASVRPPPTSAEAFKIARKQAHTSRGGQKLTAVDLEMGNDSTRERAFVAALYLRHRLSLTKAQLKPWCASGIPQRLKTIANDIRVTEPRLRGTDVNTLIEHYLQVMKLYRELDVQLKAGAYPNWTPTRFSNIARELCKIEKATGVARLRGQMLEKRIWKKERDAADEWMESFHYDAGIDYFDRIFEDPPNVDELLRSVHPPPGSPEAFKKATKSLSTIPVEAKLKAKYLRMGSDATRERAFIAALYLRDRLSLADTELQTWCSEPPEKRLSTIVNEIRGAEPMLQGFSPDALMQHHRRLIALYCDLQKKLKAGAYWRPTRFSNIVRDLWMIQNGKRPRIESFVHIFKDPPNADELLGCVRPPPASMEAFNQANMAWKTIGRRGKLGTKHLQMGDDLTRERAFIAALYFRDRLRLGEMKLQSWCTSRLDIRLNTVARNIRAVEPRLRDFSLRALVEHYRQLITLYLDLEVEMNSGARHEWKPTHFSNIALELHVIEGSTGIAKLGAERTKRKESLKMA